MGKTTRARSALADHRRKHRPRPTPRWLKSEAAQGTAQGQARARCLLVLSVLSGETPVSDAIARAGISRQTYYNLETRALQGMLLALDPASNTQGSAAAERVGQLEQQVQALQQQKRRAERLLMLGRKTMRLPGRISPLAKIKRRGRAARSVRPTTSATTAPGAPSP